MDTLGDHARREVLNYFENHTTDSAASFETVVDFVDRRVVERDQEHLSNALVHNHLPKLQSRGWLDYDRRTGDVRYYGDDDAAELLSDVADVFHES